MAIDARQFTSTVYITVNGTVLSDAQMSRVREVVVEQSLHLPDMFVIQIYDAGDDSSSQPLTYFNVLDSNLFPIGAEVEISMGREDTPQTIVTGEVTAVDLDVALGRAPLMIVRGYARSHRLHRGEKSRSFQNVTDSDVATRIAQEVGLAIQADATSEVYAYLYQSNQTNWEFLRERAARIGYEMFVEGRVLHFRKPPVNQHLAPPQNIWENLLSLRVGVSSSFQADQVIVRSWDPKQKAAIVGTATRGDLAPSIGLGKTGAQVASPFGQATVYIVDRPVATQSEANALAAAVYNQLDGAFIQAEGLCVGDPWIKPGQTVEMKTIGATLSGKYYITSATHTISSDGYSTAFVVSGKQTDSVVDLLDNRNEGLVLPRIVTGIVTDNSDPEEGEGRVKVKFPWLTEDDQSWWARLASPMAGAGRGVFFIPEVNDEVLVSFEQGDITRPFILGALWNGKDKPPKTTKDVVANSQVNQRIIKTRAGHVITLDDTSDAELISIIDKTGKNLIKIESKSNKITIQADGDVVVQANGNANVSAQGKVDVSAEKDVDVTAKGNAKVNAEQDVTVNGMNANVQAKGNASVEAQGNLELKGAVVNVEAQGTMSIKANGPLSLQGAIVSIN